MTRKRRMRTIVMVAIVLLASYTAHPEKYFMFGPFANVKKVDGRGKFLWWYQKMTWKVVILSGFSNLFQCCLAWLFLRWYWIEGSKLSYISCYHCWHAASGHIKSRLIWQTPIVQRKAHSQRFSTQDLEKYFLKIFFCTKRKQDLFSSKRKLLNVP